jgi:hypothetical protein
VATRLKCDRGECRPLWRSCGVRFTLVREDLDAPRGLRPPHRLVALYVARRRRVSVSAPETQARGVPRRRRRSWMHATAPRDSVSSFVRHGGVLARPSASGGIGWAGWRVPSLVPDPVRSREHPRPACVAPAYALSGLTAPVAALPAAFRLPASFCALRPARLSNRDVSRTGIPRARHPKRRTRVTGSAALASVCIPPPAAAVRLDLRLSAFGQPVHILGASCVYDPRPRCPPIRGFAPYTAVRRGVRGYTVSSLSFAAPPPDSGVYKSI